MHAGFDNPIRPEGADYRVPPSTTSEERVTLVSGTPTKLLPKQKVQLGVVVQLRNIPPSPEETIKPRAELPAIVNVVREVLYLGVEKYVGHVVTDAVSVAAYRSGLMDPAEAIDAGTSDEQSRWQSGIHRGIHLRVYTRSACARSEMRRRMMCDCTRSSLRVFGT